MLKNRIDSQYFSTEQLVLGTLFFTVLVFLFTTVAVYCVCFAAFYLVILSMNLVIQILNTVLIEFPLYELLFVKHIPSGKNISNVWYRMISFNKDSGHIYYKMEAQQSSLSSYFVELQQQIMKLLKEFAINLLTLE